MNKLQGKLLALQTGGHVALADIDVAGDTLSALVMESETQSMQLQPGAPVLVLFQETEVSLAKNLSGLISLRNRLSVRIQQIDKGAVLTRVVLKFHAQTLVSIITTRSAERLSLMVGDEVEALIKANEVTIVPASQEVSQPLLSVITHSKAQA